MSPNTAPPTVFLGARFITLDPRQPVAEAMIVMDEKIFAVGTREEMLTLAGPNAQIQDLAGQIAIPGFHDSHMHLMGWGLSMDGAELATARSIQELIALGQAYAQNNPQKRWIVGRGFNDEQFLESRLPTREDLDCISVSQPVIFTRVCGHLCSVNSKALELAGIDTHTPDPPGGSIDRDKHSGQPTGVLRENAMELVNRLIPPPTVQDRKEIIRRASVKAAAMGLTTIQSNDIFGSTSLQEDFDAYAQLDQAGELPIRFVIQATMPSPKELREYVEAYQAYGPSPRLRLGPLKLYADGSLGGRTAALTAPYADALGTTGMLLYDQAELDELVCIAAQHNLQVAVHAIGDRALDLVLNSYERAKILYPAWNRRPRVIHAQITRFDQLQRMARLGVVADIQPIFVPTDLHFVDKRIGPTRAEHAYAWKSMLRLGIATAGGSDCPVESCNPLWGLHAAITRQDRQGSPPEGWHPQECLSPWEALHLFTVGSAYSTHEEQIKGTLSPGKLADFVVLPKDPLTVDPQELLDLKISATFIGGKRVSP